MSIYEKVGGSDALRVAVTVFYDRVVADPELAEYFSNIDLSRLRGHQQSFLIAALGGPDYYGGRDLRRAHEGLDIDDAAFDRIVAHLSESLTSVGVEAHAVDDIVNRVGAMRGSIVTSGPEPASGGDR